MFELARAHSNLQLEAAKRASEVKVTIFEALADIPVHIAHAREYLAIYQQDRSRALKRRTAELCSEVLVALRFVIDYFAEGTLSRSG